MLPCITYDILWRNISGAVAVWLMDGITPVDGGVSSSASTSWQIKGVGDFDGDGKADILWHNTSGAVAVWLMDGLTPVSGGGAGSAAGGWQIKGVGDFDGP